MNIKKTVYNELHRKAYEWELAHETLDKMQVPRCARYPRDDLAWRVDFLQREIATDRLMNGKTFEILTEDQWIEIVTTLKELKERKRSR